MFLDIGWSEMAVILAVALVVIGPKDLPRLARQIGRWSTKARAMAREFQRSLDDMAREAELQDIKAEMEKLSRTDVRQQIEETIDPEGELRRSLAAPLDEPAAGRAAEEEHEPASTVMDDLAPAENPQRSIEPPAASKASVPAGEKS